MRNLRIQPQIPCRTVQIRCHDIPGHSPFGEVVQCGETARQRIRLLVGERQGESEPEGFGDRGHRRDRQGRVIDRKLGGVGHCGVSRTAVDVIRTQHVGQKQQVETARLQGLGEIGPVAQAFVAMPLIIWMAPQAGRLMPDTCHVEGIQIDPAHRESPIWSR
ncbi:Uncharacterised protein [Mycobacteroides abscessus subsp. massiliense]|nr:Uncharacterised protein [Mycobacteroides abscessus subsp. massiliense]